MGIQHDSAFNVWLQAQLRARAMSQRQLAQRSGVNHSTISRLLRSDRKPSLGTALKLARGLRELPYLADLPQYLELVGSGATNPTARVEYALRSDDDLSTAQVRQIMEYYLAVRKRRHDTGPAQPAAYAGVVRSPYPPQPPAREATPMDDETIERVDRHARPRALEKARV